MLKKLGNGLSVVVDQLDRLRRKIDYESRSNDGKNVRRRAKLICRQRASQRAKEKKAREKVRKQERTL